MLTEDFRRIFVPGRTGDSPVDEVHALLVGGVIGVGSACRPRVRRSRVGQVGLNVYRRHFGSLFEQWMFAEFVICWFEMAFNPKMPK